jgi:hypothetical protein
MCAGMLNRKGQMDNNLENCPWHSVRKGMGQLHKYTLPNIIMVIKSGLMRWLTAALLGKMRMHAKLNS